MPELRIRRANSDDDDRVLDLCATSLGWVDGAVDRRFFDWKHRENPAGRSPSWLALDGDRVVGVRMFMRWRFVEGDTELKAVRAVDTATDPAYRGRGIFRRLTLGALPELRSDGVDFVFNTPNAQSRPGYLGMGWSDVGRAAAAVVASPRSLPRLLAARVPADRWSLPCDTGVPAVDAVDRLDPAAVPTRFDGRLHTAKDRAWLRWRYRFEELCYRGVPLDERHPERGVAIIRLRQRGAAVECTLADVVAVPGTSAVGTVRSLAERTGADLVVMGSGGFGLGGVPVPVGPKVTWRPVGRPGVPSRRRLALTMGDLELF